VGKAVGYDCEAAFSRAFKKLTGRSPSEWRVRAMRARECGEGIAFGRSSPLANRDRIVESYLRITQRRSAVPMRCGSLYANDLVTSISELSALGNWLLVASIPLRRRRTKERI
jgi:hypothetical protein